MLELYWKRFLIPYWMQAATAVVCFVVASAAGLAAPLIIMVLIDSALQQGELRYLHFIVGGIVLLYLIRAIFFFFYSYNMAKAGNNMISRLRQNMFIRLQSLDYGYFLNTNTGNVVSYFTNDLWLIQQAVSLGLPDLVVESLNLAAIMAIMIYFNWELALVTFLTLPFIIAAIGYFNRKLAGLAMLLEHSLAKVTSILHQSLMSMLLVQSYVREDYEYRKFSVEIREAAEDLFKVQRLNALLIPLVEFLAAIGLTIIIWFGGREVIDGHLTIGGMFAFLVYIINIPAPVRKITEAWSRMKLGIVAWDRIQDLERETTAVPDGTLELPQISGRVEFRRVSFRYRPDEDVLKDISVIAEPGDVVAIVGPSGAGKSSFANLLLRFYDPSAGTILFDGVDIRQFTIRSLRRHIGFIQQEPILFNASILENIRYGRPAAPYSKVEEAARLANAHDFIMELPKGYETPVGELGGQLSGGQRQRLALARAIILEPAILLLDEPTAALDTQAEKQVMQAIRNASAGRTTFLITHNLALLFSSDKIVYLSHGQVLEAGTHDELMRRGGPYARAVEQGELGMKTGITRV
ncbi:MAG TPA: ABC transporter ATP-binding protein [Selenomonadales bacterium]|nr:ABC transporter ATP-binding protein [Selenomonadales bacterium]